MKLVNGEEACHTANDNLIDFVLVQKERFLFENCFDKILNAFC